VYGALTFFIFYGYDHLVEPLRKKAAPDPGWAWRALMASTRLWMGNSGQPEPVITKIAPRPMWAELEVVGESVPAEPLAQSNAATTATAAV
jgi:hypothetical protein